MSKEFFQAFFPGSNYFRRGMHRDHLDPDETGNVQLPIGWFSRGVVAYLAGNAKRSLTGCHRITGERNGSFTWRLGAMRRNAYYALSCRFELRRIRSFALFGLAPRNTNGHKEFKVASLVFAWTRREKLFPLFLITCRSTFCRWKWVAPVCCPRF